MEQKVGLLKNIDKFKNIKLAKGVNLSPLIFSTRERNKNESCVSCNAFGGKWFHLKDGSTAIFKTYDGDYKKEIRMLRIANELICEKLANLMGIGCAKYEPAHLNEYSGLISHNFLNQNQTLLSLHNFLMINQGDDNLVSISDAVDMYKMLGYDVDKKQIIYDIYKIMIFDALTLQSDRHSNNVNFVKDNETFNISVAKLIDNEFAFHIENLSELSKNNSTSLPQLINNYSQFAKIITVDGEMHSIRRYRNQVKELSNLAKSDETMMKILKTCISGFKIDTAIKAVENMGIAINTEYKRYLNSCSLYTKRLFLHELNKPKTCDTSYIYNEFLNI